MGGGAISTRFLSPGKGLADPHIISLPPTETSNLERNKQFSTICRAPNKTCSAICRCHDQTIIKSRNPLSIIEDDETTKRSCWDCVFGPVPAQLEVEKAISDLQRFIAWLSESDSDLCYHQPVLDLYESRMLQSSPGYQRICDALDLLETDPSVKKMVLSISCDKAVWEAILRNDAVQNLHSSLSAAEEQESLCLSKENGIANLILKWILGITKSRIVELLEKFVVLASEIFQPTQKRRPTSELDDLLEEKVKSSVLLSVLILMIVVVTRNYGS